MPDDYNEQAIFDHQTRALMEKVTFEHGGPEYDAKYPDGIPTSVIITDRDGQAYDSGLVMYPAGHARNTTANLDELLSNKWQALGALASDDPQAIIDRFNALPQLSADDLTSLYEFQITERTRLE